MIERAPLLLLLLILTVEVFAQEKLVAVKVGEFDESAETLEKFRNQTTSFLLKLRNSPDSVRGFIAIYALKDSKQTELHGIAKSLIGQNEDLEDRVRLSMPGWLYHPEFKKTEFWLIPSGVKDPYERYVLDLTCPTFGLFGSDVVRKTDKKLPFTAFVTGAGSAGVTFAWGIKGGTIIAGEGTPAITVKPSRNAKQVTAMVKLGGLPPLARCLDQLTYTTKIVP